MAQIPKNIDNAVRKFVSELREEIPVKKAIIFGSYARGDYKKDSDVDIAVFSDFFKGTSRVDGIKFLLARARKYSRLDFQPIPFTFQEYIDPDGFAAEVVKEGIEIV